MSKTASALAVTAIEHHRHICLASKFSLEHAKNEGQAFNGRCQKQDQA